MAMTVAGTRRTTLRQVLIAGQVWLTVILLAGAFLFTRSLRNLQTQPLGMNTQNIVRPRNLLSVSRNIRHQRNDWRSSNNWNRD